MRKTGYARNSHKDLKEEQPPERRPGDNYVLFGAIAGMLAGVVVGLNLGNPFLFVPVGFIVGGVADTVIGSLLKHLAMRRTRTRWPSFHVLHRMITWHELRLSTFETKGIGRLAADQVTGGSLSAAVVGIATGIVLGINVNAVFLIFGPIAGGILGALAGSFVKRLMARQSKPHWVSESTAP
jgi:uncharacterized membrane protein